MQMPEGIAKRPSKNFQICVKCPNTENFLFKTRLQIMVVIRLARGGAKKSPFYHIVVTNKTNARDGRFIERVGYFNPNARGKAVRLELKSERIEHWIKQGAQLSERVSYIVKNQQEESSKKIETAAK
jgi:small subunit ribosomal protein S16